VAVITEKMRKVLARTGVAMPDGSYYIRNAQELNDAIHAVGRGDASHDAIRKHIIKRADDLKLSAQIPDDWNSDGSLKNPQSVGHTGVEGLYWSVDDQRELEIYLRVAQGRGVKHELPAVRSCMSAVDSAHHKGSVESFSRSETLRLQAQKQRIESGHGTNLDQLSMLAHATSEDLVRKLAQKPVDDKTPAIHSSTTEEEFFNHFGVKGMHWGARRSSAELTAKAEKHEKTSAVHGHLAAHYGQQHQEIQEKGIYSQAFKNVYGDKAPLENEGIFRLKNGRGKAQALEEVNQTIQSLHNSHARSANRHSKKAAKLREKAKFAMHDGFATGFVDDEDFLEHFGVKGMHWGVRRSSSGGGSGHQVSPDAARAEASAATVRRHGTSALSNQDLQHLVNRVNLENQHARLTAETTGKTVVKKFLIEQGKRQLNEVTNELATQGRRKAYGYGAKYGAKLAKKAIVSAGKHALS
jgi:hypothetical protein